MSGNEPCPTWPCDWVRDPHASDTRTPASPGSDVVDTVAAVLERWDNTPPPNAFTGHAYTDIAADVVAALTSLKASALPSGDGWQDIASAPRDRLIDIWVSGPGARRIADCRWGKPSKANWGDRYGDDKNLPEQWITLGGFALDRRNGRATHWRPLPDPPGTLKPSAISASPEVGEDVATPVEQARSLLVRLDTQAAGTFGLDNEETILRDAIRSALTDGER